MGKRKTMAEFYNDVAEANDGVTSKDVRSLFIWYDLLSCALPFQIIFILIYYLKINNYAFTMLCVIFVYITDNILINALKRDGTNYKKFNKHKNLVKLWVIPLILMAISTSTILVLTTFGLI